MIVFNIVYVVIQNKQFTLEAPEDCVQQLTNYLIDCVSRQVTTSTLLMASLEFCDMPQMFHMIPIACGCALSTPINIARIGRLSSCL